MGHLHRPRAPSEAPQKLSPFERSPKHCAIERNPMIKLALRRATLAALRMLRPIRSSAEASAGVKSATYPVLMPSTRRVILGGAWLRSSVLHHLPTVLIALALLVAAEDRRPRACHHRAIQGYPPKLQRVNQRGLKRRMLSTSHGTRKQVRWLEQEDFAPTRCVFSRPAMVAQPGSIGAPFCLGGREDPCCLLAVGNSQVQRRN